MDSGIPSGFFFWIVIGVGVIGILYFISLYNYLVRLKNNVTKNWANIDVLLKQRNSELPKLIETCKQYMTFEKGTLEAIVEARQTQQNQAQNPEGVNVSALGAAESVLRSQVGRIFALAENYPDLKTNKSFLQLQGRISDLENAISDRREFYNESVNINNVAIEQFPSNVVAGVFQFKHVALLEFSAAEKQDVDIKGAFG